MNIKQRVVMVAAVTALASCVMPMDDLVRGDFSAIQPGSVPPTMVGIWSGNLGKNLASIRLQSDGAGVSCGSWKTKDVTQPIKYIDGKLFFQDGTRVVISQADPDSIQLLRAYSGDESSTLVRDTELQKASTLCAELIREK